MEQARIRPELIPMVVSDEGCRILQKRIGKALSTPEGRADFRAWKREQRKKEVAK